LWGRQAAQVGLPASVVATQTAALDTLVAAQVETVELPELVVTTGSREETPQPQRVASVLR
jgi:hypothetical protein